METTYRRLKESLDNRKNKNIEQKVRNRHMQLLNIFCKEIKEKHKKSTQHFSLFPEQNPLNSIFPGVFQGRKAFQGIPGLLEFARRVKTLF